MRVMKKEEIVRLGNYFNVLYVQKQKTTIVQKV